MVMVQGKGHARGWFYWSMPTHHFELSLVLLLKGELIPLLGQRGVFIRVFYVLFHDLLQSLEYVGQKARGSFLNPVDVCHDQYYT